MEDEVQKCSYVQPLPFENGQIYQNGASMPQQLCPLWVCMFTEVSCVATHSPPHFVLPQLRTAVVPQGPLWGQQWALGRAGAQ